MITGLAQAAEKYEGVQRLHTKDYGTIEIVRSWCQGDEHIAKLASGAYCHLTGLPVQSEAELKRAIPPGKDLDEALDWFNHRFDEPETKPKRVVCNADGSFVWDDGTPVTFAEALQFIPPGPIQNEVLAWLYKMEQEAKAAQKARDTLAGNAAAKVAGKAKGRTMSKNASKEKAAPAGEAAQVTA